MTKKEKNLRKICEEEKEKEREYLNPKTDNDYVKWFSMGIAIWDEKDELKCKQFYVDETDESCDDKWNTLGKICDNLGIERKEYGVITIILERGLDGEIWQYNNYHDKKWHHHGDTKGYA